MTSEVNQSELVEVRENARQLYTAQEISNALDELAETLNVTLGNQPVLVLSVLKGGIVITGHLVTRLNFDCQIDYLHATRYRDSTQGHQLNWIATCQTEIKDRVVLVLDDIFDEGVTLEAIIEYCREQGARQVLSAVLVNKHHDRKQVTIEPDFSALDIDDEYVFGFGMDYKGHFRHLNGIYAVGS